MRTKAVLGSEDCDGIVSAAKAEAARNHWNVSIAIVDEGGHLLRFDRGDGAGLMTVEVALEKAKSAALSCAPTGALEEMAAARPGLLSLRSYVFVQGGVPIMYLGACVGGIGVSGVESHHDEQIARAGIAALG